MYIINAFKGIFIGVALVVPGLSGSILALVMGLYEGIIHAISDFRHDVKKNTLFLAPIGIGAAIGILASARIVLWLCQTYPLQSYLFFAGLVLGAYPLIFRKIRKGKYKPVYILALALGFSFMVIAGGLSDTGLERAHVAIDRLESISDFWALFIAGCISVSLMMIPGVSGSVMLMTLGQYGTVYNAVGMSVDLIGYILRGNFEAAGAVFMSVLLVLPFGLGAIVGIGFIAKIIKFFLSKWETVVYYAVMGLVSGAVFLLVGESGILVSDSETVSSSVAWLALGENFFSWSWSGNLIGKFMGVVFLIIGLLCTLLLDKPGKS